MIDSVAKFVSELRWTYDERRDPFMRIYFEIDAQPYLLL